jgi:hypothetical protein
MKKVSTTAVKQARNVAEQKLTTGVGSGRSIELVLEAGEVLLEQKLSTTAKAMREAWRAAGSLRRRGCIRRG